jgi:hypothetical protein
LGRDVAELVLLGAQVSDEVCQLFDECLRALDRHAAEAGWAAGSRELEDVRAKVHLVKHALQTVGRLIDRAVAQQGVTGFAGLVTDFDPDLDTGLQSAVQSSVTALLHRLVDIELALEGRVRDLALEGRG